MSSRSISLKPTQPNATLGNRNGLTDEQGIRTARNHFNQAIADHNIKTVSQHWLPDIHVSASDGRVLLGKTAVEAAFKQFFAEPSFVTFTRMPNKIDIGDDRENAAEHGEWVGMWKSPNGFTERRGCYLAGWRRVNGRWLLQSELFISLKWM